MSENPQQDAPRPTLRSELATLVDERGRWQQEALKALNPETWATWFAARLDGRDPYFPYDREEFPAGAADLFRQFFRENKSESIQGFRMTLADEAVYRFALVLDKKVEKEYVLLYYDRTAFASFLMPVPPDAGFFPLFRPVTPEEGHSFGRTCPGRPGDCKEDLAEDELVHPNSSVAYDAV